MATSKLPVALPAHWYAEDDWRGTLIHAVDRKGHILASVTVNETVRGYLIGVQAVPAFHGKAKRYMRRGWRLRLYRDALAALMSAWRGLQRADLREPVLHGAARQPPGDNAASPGMPAGTQRRS
ncbi:hypothetical protein [uncultured Azohydromonas sp.]|jgi:hypothetical protein|uniref:hypothetical protein n=1 Tax=uncultured Azohydromonas sp. TaxID=487342 RepID=UPI00260C2763|nr:hypothetical protein [uncultured Azohydromonas sp.]